MCRSVIYTNRTAENLRSPTARMNWLVHYQRDYTHNLANNENSRKNERKIFAVYFANYSLQRLRWISWNSISWKPLRFASWFPTLISCSPNLPRVYIRLCKHGNHFTFLHSNAWHDILFELEMSRIPPQLENIEAILCRCLYLQQKYSKMEWNQKNV